jgi:hypothetical protein
MEDKLLDIQEILFPTFKFLRCEIDKNPNPCEIKSQERPIKI